MKKIVMLLALLVAGMQLHAQNKLWLSGYHSNASLKYLYDGTYATIPVVWEGGTPRNNTNVVVFGQFKKDNSGTVYFSVERSEQRVTLYSGNYSRSNFSCPLQYNEGKLITSGNVTVTYASFIPLGAQGYMTVTKAEWGIKVCNGTTYNVYYIRDIEGANNAGQYVQEQRVVPSSGIESGDNGGSNVLRYTGRIITIEKDEPLDVKNFAILQCDNGDKIRISSVRPMKVGERVNLEGYDKMVYWDGVMKTSWVFFVNRIYLHLY